MIKCCHSRKRSTRDNRNIIEPLERANVEEPWINIDCLAELCIDSNWSKIPSPKSSRYYLDSYYAH